MTGTLVAVCAVYGIIDGHSAVGRTAIDKRPLDGAVRIEQGGVAGDRRYNVKDHGGDDQAVYAYAREEAARWADELGVDIPPGRFGENLSVTGMTVTDAVVGERWRIGTASLEVTMPRTPCRTFQSWMGEPQWIKRFSQRGDTGCYLRVLAPGTVRAGDTIEVIHRPAHAVTVREVFTAAEQDPRRLRRLLDDAEYLAEKAERRVRKALEAMAGNSH